MKDFIEGIVAPIDRDNIDTDQIIPTEYLKSIKNLDMRIIFLMAGDIKIRVVLV